MTTDGYDEFALLKDNATEVGLPWPGRPTVSRISTDVGGGQQVSSLLWGTRPPRIAFLHGGGQNAHTWDTVILALGVPALAVDLPGHGHSDRRPDRDYMPWTAADAVAAVLRRWAPAAEVVVGMSLGGLTAIRLTAIAPDLVRRAVIIDVTPSVHERQTSMTPAQRGTTALIRGAATFTTREEMIELAIAAAPARPASAVRRGVVHNSRQRPDGRWEWRYDQLAGPGDFSPLWEHVSAATMPLTLVRGGASAFVPDADAEEFHRRNPAARIHLVPGAGHSVQSDAPLALADILRPELSH
jgi:pimeloyl-ACP methyl ester carboxylesterase